MITKIREDRTGLTPPRISTFHFILQTTVGVMCLVNLPSVQAEETTTTATTKTSDDATNQSSRERDRILLKRNPIASEYQLMGPPGEFYGATKDAEGVDFRAQFSLPRGKADASSVRFEADMNYQSLDESIVPGGSLNLAKSFGPLSLQFQIQRNASKRTVDLYQARWLAISEPSLSDEDVLLMGFPRYSQDTFDTTSLNTRWRADYTFNPNVVLTYEGMATDYDDAATRNRIEFQNGVGDISDAVLSSDGTTISDATITSSQIRRYYHQTKTARDINRHRLGLTIDEENGSTEVGVYYSHWVNQVEWRPWNFVDKGITSSYNIDDLYLPEDSVDTDLYDTSNATFANYRRSLTTTTDTDYAFLLDWDHKFTLAEHKVWVGAGLAWRNKERDNTNRTSVYYATDSSFSLSDVTGDNGNISILNGDYLLPTAIDYSTAYDYFNNNSDAFAFSESQSFLESVQNLYTSEETVSSAYLNAYQQLNQWFWRAGLRLEHTQTKTRGAVSGPVEADITSEGEAITSLVINGETIEETFDTFDAAFVEGGNSYNHLLPSLEMRYSVSPKLKFKMEYFEQLMRPQYYDTVRYRRINVATRTITEGSPDLEATTIHNVYGGFEYHYSEDGQLVAGLYYNKVANFFYDSVVTEELDDVVYDVTRVENGKDGYIQGFQGYWSHQFSFPLVEQANVALSYVYSDSEANLEDRKISMPERADHRVAFNLTLADGPWQYASQFTWQSEAVDDVGQTAEQDTIREDVLSWNQSFAWHFNKQWTTKFSLHNVLNTPERSYQGSPNRVVNNLYSGSSARLSVIFNY